MNKLNYTTPDINAPDELIIEKAPARVPGGANYDILVYDVRDSRTGRSSAEPMEVRTDSHKGIRMARVKNDQSSMANQSKLIRNPYKQFMK